MQLKLSILLAIELINYLFFNGPPIYQTTAMDILPQPESLINEKRCGTSKNIAVIVAHPDDETLWSGGTMLMHPNYRWFVACLCRRYDPDRAPKFAKVLNVYQAQGIMGDLDDGPEQLPLATETVKEGILNLLPTQDFDLIITHSPFGEYTRHLRHEEIGRAVIELWNKQKISTRELWTFAYEDGHKKYYPKAMERANIYQQLPPTIWNEKYRIITKVYGFDEAGFEAKTTPKIEAFWKFETPADAIKWWKQEEVQMQTN